MVDIPLLSKNWEEYCNWAKEKVDYLEYETIWEMETIAGAQYNDTATTFSSLY